MRACLETVASVTERGEERDLEEVREDCPPTTSQDLSALLIVERPLPRWYLPLDDQKLQVCNYNTRKVTAYLLQSPDDPLDTLALDNSCELSNGESAENFSSHSFTS